MLKLLLQQDLMGKWIAVHPLPFEAQGRHQPLPLWCGRHKRPTRQEAAYRRSRKSKVDQERGSSYFVDVCRRMETDSLPTPPLLDQPEYLHLWQLAGAGRLPLRVHHPHHTARLAFSPCILMFFMVLLRPETKVDLKLL
jgi:hypothetical protein